MERRLIGLEALKLAQLQESSVQKMDTILTKEFMSSEQSEFEDVEENEEMIRKLRGYRVRTLPWERTRLQMMKEQLDEAYEKTMSRHARGMVKYGVDGASLDRPAPQGEDWAVRYKQ